MLAGSLAYEQLQALPIDWVEASEALLISAAQIKATHSLSLADAWITASDVQCGATPLHKYPEFQFIDGLARSGVAGLKVLAKKHGLAASCTLLLEQSRVNSYYPIDNLPACLVSTM